jgi:hypothetical protein
MEQNNFEKKVQQKMDELKIPPSEHVWTNIEKKIEKKGKDKRTIFILFFLLLFLLSGGYWLLNSGKNHQLKNKQISSIIKKNGKPILSINKQTNKPGSSLSQIISASQKSDSTALAYKDFKRLRVLTGKAWQKYQSDFPNNKKQKRAIKKERNNTNEDVLHSTPVQEITSKQINNTNNNFEKPGENLPVEKSESADLNNDEISENVIPGKIEKDSLPNQPGSEKTESTINVNEKLVANKSSKTNQKHPWIFGITFSGGTSMVEKIPVGTSYLNLNSPGNLSNGGIPYSYSNPSLIKNSIGFNAGVLIEKNISPKTKISIGISYKYYSLINKVGNKIDSTLSSSQYFSSLNNSYSSTNTVNSYRNNFHYLDLPVSIKFQLNKNKKLPLFWNAGINISQLISSNALQFQSNPGIYYHDNSLFNKTQLGLHTGFSVMLFAKEKNPLTVGPNFYYSATSISGKGLYSKRHFSFIGIQAKVLFRKK